MKRFIPKHGSYLIKFILRDWKTHDSISQGPEVVQILGVSPYQIYRISY